MMKYYLLLDLAVLALVAALPVAASLLGFLGAPYASRAECDAPLNINGPIFPLADDNAYLPAAATTESSAQTQEDAPASPTDSPTWNHLKLGGLVEVHRYKGLLANPATITEIVHGTTHAKYTIHDDLTKAVHAGVLGEFIHPYRLYEDGTQAMCNIGPRDIRMVPCRVVSNLIKRSGFIQYQVEFEDDDGNAARRSLPYSRVQRMIAAR